MAGGGKTYSLVGGGTIHVREGEVGTENSSHVLQYIKMFFIYLFYIIKNISKIRCYISMNRLLFHAAVTNCHQTQWNTYFFLWLCVQHR